MEPDDLRPTPPGNVVQGATDGRDSLLPASIYPAERGAVLRVEEPLRCWGDRWTTLALLYPRLCWVMDAPTACPHVAPQVWTNVEGNCTSPAVLLHYVYASRPAPFHSAGARRPRPNSTYREHSPHANRRLLSPRRLHPGYRRRGLAVGQERQQGRDPLPARTQRLPAHRARPGRRPQPRDRRGERRDLQPALRRHQPHQGEHGLRGGDPARPALAGYRLGGESVLCVGLLRDPLRIRCPADRGGEGLRVRPESGGDQGVQRHPDRAGQGESLPRPLGG